MQTITWKGRLGPMELQASDHTFQPSTISTLVAKVLEVKEGDVVIDVGCGTGILGIIAAKLGAAKVYGVDASPDVVAVATANAQKHGVADRMEFYHGDLFSPLPDGVKTVAARDGQLVLVHQTPPAVHNFRWIARDSRHSA